MQPPQLAVEFINVTAGALEYPEHVLVQQAYKTLSTEVLAGTDMQHLSYQLICLHLPAGSSWSCVSAQREKQHADQYLQHCPPFSLYHCMWLPMHRSK